MGVFAFKIGIAYDPRERWEMYGEDDQMWLFMEVMHEDVPEECSCLERELIARLRTIPGCYNVLPGGEDIRAGVREGKCSCYAVYARAGHGVGLRQAWLERQQRQ